MHTHSCEALTAEHILTDFDCGNSELNSWLQDHALPMQRRDYSRVFVLCLLSDSHVLGYFSLSAASMMRQEFSVTDQRKELRETPVILLGKLAVDLRVQGQGLATALLVQALDRAANVSISVGARYIAVDPIDDWARALYTRYGFSQGSGERMYMRIKDMFATVAAASRREPQPSSGGSPNHED